MIKGGLYVYLRNYKGIIEIATTTFVRARKLNNTKIMIKFLYVLARIVFQKYPMHLPIQN